MTKRIEFKKQVLPIPFENYLVFKDGEIKISLYRGDWNMFHCDINRNVGEPFVTHWAELPEKPTIVKQ